MRSVTALNPFRRADAEIERMSTYLIYSLTFLSEGRCMDLLMRSVTAFNPFRRADAEIERKCLQI